VGRCPAKRGSLLPSGAWHLLQKSQRMYWYVHHLVRHRGQSPRARRRACNCGSWSDDRIVTNRRVHKNRNDGAVAGDSPCSRRHRGNEVGRCPANRGSLLPLGAALVAKGAWHLEQKSRRFYWHPHHLVRHRGQSPRPRRRACNSGGWLDGRIVTIRRVHTGRKGAMHLGLAPHRFKSRGEAGECE